MSITAYKVEAVGHDRTGEDYGYVNIMYRYGNKQSCPRPDQCEKMEVMWADESVYGPPAPGSKVGDFIFDVEEELTDDPAAMDAVGKMLDEAEILAEKAKAAIKAALADEDSRYHSVVTFFMEFHRDDVGPNIAAELFPGTDPSKLSFAEMVGFLKLKRFGSLVDDEMEQQVFIMDLSFNPEITDELMVIYFDLNQEIFCITHES